MPILTTNRIIAFIVSLALFMDSLDATIINTAIPAMSRSLHVNPVDLKVGLISYLISLAIFIPISGWAADKYGLKQVFITALIIFTLSSVWCGYSKTLTELVIARSVQGLGGGLMLPVGRLILLHTFKRHELVSVMNHVIMIVSIGLMLGPLAGGFITDNLSWPWIFWINLPVGILAALVAYYWLKDKVPRKARPLDVVGFILFGGGLAAITFALSDFSQSDANLRQAFAILLLGILMLAAYFLYSRNRQNSIVNIRLLRFRTFKVSLLGNILGRLGFAGVPFLLPLLLQVSFHYSAQLSGFLLAPIALGVMLNKLVSTRILRFLGYKRLLLMNTLLVGLSLWSFRIINQETAFLNIALLTLTFGFLISLQYSGMNSLAYADIDADDLSSATSIISAIQQLSQSLGVATSAILLRIYSYTATDTSSVLLSPLIFHQTFFTLGLLSLLSMIIFIQLKPNDGYQMLTAPAQEKIATH